MGKRVWTSQPQYPAALNREYRYVNNIVYALHFGLGGTPYDVKSGLLMSPTATLPLNVANSDGRARSYNGSNSGDISGSIPRGGGVSTYIIRVATTTLNNNYIFSESTSGVNYFGFRGNSSSTAMLLALGGGTNATATGLPNWCDGRVHTIALVTHSTTDRRLYIDGALVYTHTANISLHPAYSYIGLGCLYRGTFELPTACTVSSVLVLNTALPPEDMASYHNRPWQIFAPQKIKNYIGAISATTHGCTGVLAGAGATIAGVAAHKVKHSSSGALAGAGATIAGVAVRKAKHICTAVIVGIGAEVAGVANRVGGAATHSSSGALGGDGATVAGVAQHYPKHICTGVLAGAGATVAGVARHVANHVASGVLAGAGAVIVGAASRPYVENLLLTPLQADGDLVNNEWLARQLRALGGNIQTNVGAMPDFNSANQQMVSIGKTPAEVKGAVLNKESTYKKLK